MSNFTLYYWPVPFRGEFVRALLAHAGATVDEPDSDAVSAMMDMDPRDQPVPHMAPPLLVDNASGKAIAEMPAICLWLAEQFNLTPSEPHQKALALKVINDANDVLDEVTLNGGKTMWTAESWTHFLPRLRRWMRIWEAAVVQESSFCKPERTRLYRDRNSLGNDDRAVTPSFAHFLAWRHRMLPHLWNRPGPRARFLRRWTGPRFTGHLSGFGCGLDELAWRAPS